MTRRTQLTLFVPPSQAAPLESLRELLDPVQSRLIAAHVTLARDEELATVDETFLERRLEALDVGDLTLTFGEPERFGGHGVLLPCIGGEDDYHALRTQVLGAAANHSHRPHITLAHPRNPRAPGNAAGSLPRIAHSTVVSFRMVSLIRQESSAPWRVVREYALGGHVSGED